MPCGGWHLDELVGSVPDVDAGCQGLDHQRQQWPVDAQHRCQFVFGPPYVEYQLKQSQLRGILTELLAKGNGLQLLTMSIASVLQTIANGGAV